MRILLQVSLLLFSSVTLAESITLTNVKLFGSEEVMSLTWEGGVIVRFGADAASTKGEVIDGGGGYITPGLIDSGSTVGIQGVNLSTTSRDHKYEGEENTVSFSPGLAFNPESSIIPSLLEEGVTHAHMKPDAGKDVFAGQGTLVDLSGGGADAEPSGVFVYLGDKGWKNAGKSRAAGLQRLLLGLAEAADYLANQRGYDRGQLRQLSFSKSDLEALSAVLAGERKLIVYVDRAGEIVTLLEALDVFEVDVVLMGAREAWKVADELAARDVPVVLNALDNLPGSFDRLGARLDQPALLHAAGVKVALMSEDLYSESRMLKQAAGVTVAYGMPWQAALDAMTINPAEIWGANQGSLEPGRAATFVVWDGDPLEVTSQTTMVFIDGQQVERVNRQQLLRDRYRDL